MNQPTEERLRDWMAGVMCAYPYYGGAFLANLILAADSGGPEDFTNMLPLLRLYYHMHPEYSYEEMLAARSCGRIA